MSGNERTPAPSICSGFFCAQCQYSFLRKQAFDRHKCDPTSKKRRLGATRLGGSGSAAPASSPSVGASTARSSGARGSSSSAAGAGASSFMLFPSSQSQRSGGRGQPKDSLEWSSEEEDQAGSLGGERVDEEDSKEDDNEESLDGGGNMELDDQENNGGSGFDPMDILDPNGHADEEEEGGADGSSDDSEGAEDGEHDNLVGMDKHELFGGRAFLPLDSDDDVSQASTYDSDSDSDGEAGGGGVDAGGSVDVDGEHERGEKESCDGSVEAGGLIWLDKSHENLKSMKNRKLLDGDEKDLRYSPEAVSGDSYLPYDNFTQAVLATFTRIASPSRSQLDLLFHCLRQTDKDGNGIRAADIPESGDHFKRRMRMRTPLFPIYGEEVEEKSSAAAGCPEQQEGSGVTKLVLSIPVGVVIQRMLDSPEFVKKLLRNTVGHTMTEADREASGVPHQHVLPVPTKRSDGAIHGAMYGDIAARSSIFGLESIVVGCNNKRATVVVGDTVMVDFSASTDGEAEPCRLDSIVYCEDRGRLVARVQRFIQVRKADGCLVPKNTSGDELPCLWEVTSNPITVEVSTLVGRCKMLRGMAADDKSEADSSLPRYRAAGFVETMRSGRYRRIKSPDSEEGFLPWRREGLHRLFYDRRREGVNWNEEPDRRVLNTAALLFTDAFNFRKQVRRFFFLLSYSLPLVSRCSGFVSSFL